MPLPLVIRAAAIAVIAVAAGCGKPPAAREPLARTTQPAPPPSPKILAMLGDMHGTGAAAVAPFRIVGNIYYAGAAGVASSLIFPPAGDILLDTGTREMIP